MTNNQFSYAFAEKRWPGVLHPEHDPAAADAKLIYNKRLTATFAYVQKTIAPTSGVIGGIVPPGAAAGVMKLHNFVLDRMAEADQRGEDKNELLDPSSSKYILGGAVMERVGGLKGSDLIKELVNTGGYAAEPRTLLDAFYNSEARQAAADPTKARDKENTVDAAWAAYKTAHPGVTDTTPTHRGAPAAAKSYTLPKAGPGRAAALQYWAQHGTWPGE